MRGSTERELRASMLARLSPISKDEYTGDQEDIAKHSFDKTYLEDPVVKHLMAKDRHERIKATWAPEYRRIRRGLGVVVPQKRGFGPVRAGA